MESYLDGEVRGRGGIEEGGGDRARVAVGWDAVGRTIGRIAA